MKTDNVDSTITITTTLVEQLKANLVILEGQRKDGKGTWQMVGFQGQKGRNKFDSTFVQALIGFGVDVKKLQPKAVATK